MALPYSARFDPSGRLVYVTAEPEEDSPVAVWDWRRQTVERRLPSLRAAGMLALAPGGATVASGFGIASIRDAMTGAVATTLDGSPILVNDVAYSPDGSLIAVAIPVPGEIRVFDVQSGRLQLVLETDSGQPAVRIAFSPDGRMLAAQSVGHVQVWSLDLEDVLNIASRHVARALTPDECRRSAWPGALRALGVDIRNGRTTIRSRYVPRT